MIEAKIDPVTLATPFFILSILLEIVLGWLHTAEARYSGKTDRASRWLLALARRCPAGLRTARANYETKDTAVSLGMGLGSTVAGLVTGGLVFAATLWVYEHRLFTIPMTAVWAWVAIFLLEDLTYYGFHRISHERRFWWVAHVNHHSSQHYNLSTALRQTWSGGVAGTWALWLPLAFLGFPPAMIAIQKGVSLVYQYWIHTEAIRRMPRWFEAVFNTPSHHRVHHARNPVYLDRNYAGILIIWDKMFGTFQPELDEEPCRYGLVKNLATFNIFRVAFHEWIATAQDVMRHPRHALGYIFGPPGWSHDGSRETSAMIKARHLPREAAGGGPPAERSEERVVEGASLIR